ncbi:uncharacterized protein LOC124814812 isoform X1 [Hydra vulgaris]|uniref:uncharacterized protein LOC124814812 isoform X1 n=1 Tax=Hydra vulgaris TaxID=6087 RepID=UPI0032EA6110
MKQNESYETLEISESLNMDESINYLFLDEVSDALLYNVSSSSELIRILELNGFYGVDLDDFMSLLIERGRINLVEAIIETFHESATESTNKSINLQMSSSLLTPPSGELSNAALNNNDIEDWHKKVTENQRNELSDKLESSIKITLKTDFLNNKDNYIENLKVYINEAEVAAYINARSKVIITIEAKKIFKECFSESQMFTTNDQSMNSFRLLEKTHKLLLRKLNLEN